MKKLFLSLTLILCPAVCFSALVDGTNAGFVTSAPSSDPSNSGNNLADYRTRCTKFTSPSDMGTVTEMGWWVDDGSAESLTPSWVIYNHDAINNKPNAIVEVYTGSVKTSTTNSWDVKNGLSWSISASTVYWMSGQYSTAAADNVYIGKDAAVGYRSEWRYANIPADPWGSSVGGFDNTIFGVYALYTPAAGGAVPDSQIIFFN